MERALETVIGPLLALLGGLLRPLGALGIGLVAGAVLRHALVYKQRTRFFVPLIFLGVVALFAVTGWAPWSSPGTLAMVGIGIFAGYLFMWKTAAPPTDEDNQSGRS